jgi:hypothetical protein
MYLSYNESQQILVRDQIIHCIVDHSGYLVSTQSSDVLPNWNTTDIGRLMIRKQQSIQFCHETKLKQTHKTLNDILN